MADVKQIDTVTTVMDIVGALLVVASVAILVGLAVWAMMGGWWGLPVALLVMGGGLVGLSSVLSSMARGGSE